MKRIMVVTDSRGRDLDHHLRHEEDCYTLHVLAGAGLVSLIDFALNSSPALYDMIVILGGICDITHKNHKSGEISLRANHASTLVPQLEDAIDPKLDLLRCIVPKTVLSTTYGVNLWRYNQHTRGYTGPSPHPDQGNLLECVGRVNEMLSSLNYKVKLPIIWLNNEVHYHRGKKRTHTRYNLMWDGCHPGPQLRKKCAALIVKAVKRTFSYDS